MNNEIFNINLFLRIKIINDKNAYLIIINNKIIFKYWFIE